MTGVRKESETNEVGSPGKMAKKPLKKKKRSIENEDEGTHR